MLHAFRESIGKYIAIAILSLIGVTFIFFGIDFSVTQSPFAAKVNGTEIPLLEFERELQNYQTQYQQLYRVELTDELRRELRRTVIDQMVLREALRQQAAEAGYSVSDERLAASIRNTEAFQVGGNFSPDTYRALLQANGMTPAIYEAQQRQSLVLSEFQNGVAASTFLTPSEYRRYIELANQRREIGHAVFSAADFMDAAEVEDAAVAEYFEANQSLFMTAESVDLEYIELDLASIAATIDVSDEELRAQYEETQDLYETAEERSVSHILINVDGDDYQTAEAQAQAALERVQGGEDFATVAREVSDDGGTASSGGSLGWIARGVLTGPFEDTLYSMAEGEIAGPVETEFGYHILKLDEIRSGQVQTFEAVRDELRTELSTEQANSLFYDRANELRQAAFDAFDQLAPVAESQGLELKTVSGFERIGNPVLFPNGEAVVDRAFSEDAIVTGRNSDLIELTEDHVVVLRVVAHNDPAPQALDDVREQIRATLRLEAAAELAGAAAAEFRAALENGEADRAARAAELGGEWIEPRWVERTDAETPAEVLAAAFAEPRSALTSALVRQVPLRNGDEAVLEVRSVEAGQPESVPVAERDQRQQLLAQQAAQLEAAAYAANISAGAGRRARPAILIGVSRRRSSYRRCCSRRRRRSSAR